MIVERSVNCADLDEQVLNLPLSLNTLLERAMMRLWRKSLDQYLADGLCDGVFCDSVWNSS